MLENFTSEAFADRLGETFRVGEGDDALDFELVEVNPGVGAPAGEGRAQFSIVFRGPPEPILPQRIYRFEKESLGAFELFIVPIGPDESGMQYEAVFG